MIKKSYNFTVYLLRQKSRNASTTATTAMVTTAAIVSCIDNEGIAVGFDNASICAGGFIVGNLVDYSANKLVKLVLKI